MRKQNLQIEKNDTNVHHVGEFIHHLFFRIAINEACRTASHLFTGCGYSLNFVPHVKKDRDHHRWLVELW